MAAFRPAPAGVSPSACRASVTRGGVFAGGGCGPQRRSSPSDPSPAGLTANRARSRRLLLLLKPGEGQHPPSEAQLRAGAGIATAGQAIRASSQTASAAERGRWGWIKRDGSGFGGCRHAGPVAKLGVPPLGEATGPMVRRAARCRDRRCGRARGTQWARPAGGPDRSGFPRGSLF